MSRTTTLSVLLALALFIGIIFSAAGYFSALNAQRELRNELDTTMRLLNLIPVPAADLEQRLADERQANDDARTTILPLNVDANAIITAIFDAADGAAVEVLPITTGRWREESLQGRVYRVLDLDFAISGKMDNIQSFITRLYDVDFTITAVNSYTLAPSNADGNLLQGTVQMKIYTQAAVTAGGS